MKREYTYHQGLQDEEVEVERDCGACRCGFTSPKEESGQQRREVTDVEVIFSTGSSSGSYDEAEDPEVASGILPPWHRPQHHVDPAVGHRGK